MMKYVEGDRVIDSTPTPDSVNEPDIYLPPTDDDKLKKSFEEFERKKNPKLKDVHAVVKKWWYLRNNNRIDLALAVYLSRQLKGTKLWLIFIGGSGGLKSELLRALDDGGNSTFIIQELTPNTLVSGSPLAEDLAPKLDNKVALILDASILLNLKKDDKAKIWAQLRELYDGNCRKLTGSGKRGKDYTGLNVTFIICSTSAIDNQILIHNELGTRELNYRLDPVTEEKEAEQMMVKVLENERFEEQMRAEIKEVIQNFLRNKSVLDIEIPTQVLDDIKTHVKYLVVLRTASSLDSFSGDLRSTAEPEFPTRILKQFKRLYQCLKSLDENYSDKKALQIIKEVRDSSCNTDRIKVLNFLIRNKDEMFTFGKIGQALKLGNSTIKRHLSVLWNLGLVDRDITEFETGKELYRWQVNLKHKLVPTIMRELGLILKEENVN